MLGRGALDIPIGPTDVTLGGTPRTWADMGAALHINALEAN